MLMMTFGIIFCENHFLSYKSPRSKINNLPGLIIRQGWNFVTFLLISSFFGVLKSTLIQTGKPKLLETNDEVMMSKRPLILMFIDNNEFDQLNVSPNKIDNWLYQQSKVFFLNK